MSYYLAIDIGGTFIKYGAVDTKGKLFLKNQVATPMNENQALLNKIIEIITMMIEMEGNPLGIGISTAGVVNSETGEVIYAGPTIANYQGMNFKTSMEAKFAIPVHVNNDVNAALLGEQWLGAAKGQKNVYCITLGTGIGGAYFSNQLVTGTSFKAGEVGYLLYERETKTTYEERASTSALKTRAESELGTSVNLIELFEKARANDHVANRIIDAWTSDIAEGLAQIIILLDPQLLLIGGGVSKQGNFLLGKIERQMNDYLPKGFSQTVLKCTELGNDAALYGAVSIYF